MWLIVLLVVTVPQVQDHNVQYLRVFRYSNDIERSVYPVLCLYVKYKNCNAQQLDEAVSRYSKFADHIKCFTGFDNICNVCNMSLAKAWLSVTSQPWFYLTACYDVFLKGNPQFLHICEFTIDYVWWAQKKVNIALLKLNKICQTVTNVRKPLDYFALTYYRYIHVYTTTLYVIHCSHI